LFYTKEDHSNLWAPFNTQIQYNNNADFIQLELDLKPKELIIPDLYKLWYEETRQLDTFEVYREIFDIASKRYREGLSTKVIIAYGFRSNDHARVLRYFSPLCWVVWEYSMEAVVMCTITEGFLFD
jgi:hypothetical protein